MDSIFWFEPTNTGNRKNEITVFGIVLFEFYSVQHSFIAEDFSDNLLFFTNYYKC
jgi:hypothetical protein